MGELFDEEDETSAVSSRFDPDKDGDMAAQILAPVPRGQLRDVLDDGGGELE